MEDEDEFFVPLQNQRVFGAGIKRKRVHFIPSATDDPTDPSELSKPGKAGDRYLSIVLPTTRPDPGQNPSTGHMIEMADLRTTSTNDGHLCQLCNLPISPQAIDMT
ncbi:MAG: hypothetical protein M1830_010428, partial [Pleopsidium flavum]